MDNNVFIKEISLQDISPRFRQERQLRAVTGLSIKQISILLPIFEVLIENQIEENKENKEKPNNGKVGALVTAKDKLIFILYYLKCYPTYDQFGFVFNMSGSSAYTWLHKVIPIFVETLAQLNVLPKMKFENPEEMYKALKGVDKLIIDATERPIQRPQDRIEQEKYYSGKKKDIRLKIQ